MINQVLAIDIAKRIDNFHEEIKKLSLHAPIQVLSSKNLDFNSLTDNKIDVILVSIYEKLEQEFLIKFNKLKHICVLGTSTKKIALDYCISKNIKVSFVTDYCDHETSEWVIWQVLQFFRESLEPKSCYEKTLGLVGVGSVGKLVAKLALALGMKVLFNAPNRHEDLEALGAKSSSKAEIFSQSQVLSFHTPAYMTWLSDDLLRLLPKNALLINTCLGSISRVRELEEFLKIRPDIRVAMDAIAGQNYKDLAARVYIDKHAAFSTPESQARLVNKFLYNIALI